MTDSPTTEHNEEKPTAEPISPLPFVLKDSPATEHIEEKSILPIVLKDAPKVEKNEEKSIAETESQNKIDP